MRWLKSKQQAERKPHFSDARRAVTSLAGRKRLLLQVFCFFALSFVVGLAALTSGYAQDKPSQATSSIRPEDKRKALEILDKAYTAASQVAEKKGRSALLARLAVLHAKAGQVNRASQIAQQVADAYWRAKALTEIAVAQAKVGQKAAAKQTFERALQIAQKVKDAFQRITILSAIATKQAEAGQFDWALQTAQAIKGTFWRTKTLQTIAEMRAGAKQRARPRHPRWTLIDAYSPDEVAYARTLSQADAGRLDQAFQSAQKIADAFFRASALAVVASGQSEGGTS